MKAFPWPATIVVLIVFTIIGYVGGCAFLSRARDKAFDLVRVGDTESAVVDLFGVAPSVRERPGELFARYASKPCTNSCVERLWFENRLSLDTQAWSVEIDQGGRVKIGRAHV